MHEPVCVHFQTSPASTRHSIADSKSKLTCFGVCVLTKIFFRYFQFKNEAIFAKFRFFTIVIDYILLKNLSLYPTITVKRKALVAPKFHVSKWPPRLKYQVHLYTMPVPLLARNATVKTTAQYGKSRVIRCKWQSCIKFTIKR